VLTTAISLNRASIKVPSAANRQDGSEVFGQEDQLIDLQIGDME
jgi:hypothetical protein